MFLRRVAKKLHYGPSSSFLYGFNDAFNVRNLHRSPRRRFLERDLWAVEVTSTFSFTTPQTSFNDHLVPDLIFDSEDNDHLKISASIYFMSAQF